MTGSEPNITRGIDRDRVERRRAIVIGVDRHVAAPRRAPATCTAHATKVAALLATHGYDVIALHDRARGRRRPTLVNVRAALAEVADASDADDAIVVYAACHGRRVGGAAYLLLADTGATPAAIRTGGLPVSELLATLRSRARWTALFVDAYGDGVGLDPTIGRSTVHGDDRDGGFALLAGSTPRAAVRDRARAGRFSQHLIDGLAGAAADPDGAIRASDLARHVQERARTTDGGRGVPLVRVEVADVPLVPPRAYLELAPPGAAAITGAAFLPDGLALVTGSADGALTVWDAQGGARLHRGPPHAAAVVGLDVSIAEQVTSASADGVVRLWSVSDGMPIGPSQPIGRAVAGVAWLDERTRVIATDDGAYVQAAHDLIAGVVDPFRVGDLRAIAACAGGFVSGAADGQVAQWRVAERDGRRLGAHAGPVVAVAAVPSMSSVASAGAGVDDVIVWDVAARTSRALTGHRGPVRALAITADGRRVASAGADGVVRIFDPATATVQRELVVEGAAGAPVAACVVRFAPDGRRLFVGYADGRARIYQLG